MIWRVYMVKCSDCGVLNATSNKFCQECGAPLKKMKINPLTTIYKPLSAEGKYKPHFPKINTKHVFLIVFMLILLIDVLVVYNGVIQSNF